MSELVPLPKYRSFDDLRIMFAFDPSTKHIDWRKRAPGEPHLPISGWIGKVGSEDVLLYNNGKHLQLLVEGRELDARHVSSELEDLGPVRHLQLCASGETVLDVTYPAPIIDPPINDVLSPVETEENYDYALFLKNVLNDPARMAVCLEAWA